MLYKILKIFGYIKIEDIKIPDNYYKPNYEKLNEKRCYQILLGKYLDKIIIDQNDNLLNGYTTLYLEKEDYKKYVKIKKVKV